MLEIPAPGIISRSSDNCSTDLQPAIKNCYGQLAVLSQAEVRALVCNFRDILDQNLWKLDLCLSEWNLVAAFRILILIVL